LFFLAVFFVFGGMFIFLPLFIEKTNFFEECSMIGTFLYIMVKFYDLIFRYAYADSQEAINDLERDNQQNISVWTFFNIVLPIFAVYLLNQWLETKDYFGWFK